MFTDIIWDFDGTLFDTYPATVNAFIKALEDSGVYEESENVLNYLKVSEKIAITYFKELYNLDNSFTNKYIAYKKDIAPEMINPFPFAKQVCMHFNSLGMRNYIITHRGNSTIKFLKHYGMLEYFTEVITKEYAFRRKPDLESFMYLIEKYNINKSTAMIIGDRECEILAGISAGIKTCLYNTNNISLNVNADLYVDCLKELVDIIN